MKLIVDNNYFLIQQGKILTENSSQDLPLFAVLYSNTVQQNLAIEQSYRKQIDGYQSQKINKEIKLIKLQRKMASLFREIEELEKDKTKIQSIKILQPPSIIQLPPKGLKIGQTVILAGTVGL
ncbi:hypothetical protein N9219_04805, partial [bacterium]|nr:hypothetical protein [bacterium]